jgi:mannose-6-phosphate isomerase-like protein (cupin superfamily)
LTCTTVEGSRHMRLLVTAIFALAFVPAACGQARILSPESVEDVLRSLSPVPPTNREVLTEAHYAVKVARLDHRSGPGEMHRNEDRLLYVLRGAASVCAGGELAQAHDLAPGESQGQLSGCKPLSMSPGTVVSIPRGVPYRMQAPDSEVEFLVVRVK